MFGHQQESLQTHFIYCVAGFRASPEASVHTLINWFIFSVPFRTVMPKRSAAGKADAEEKEELQSFPDELAINSDTSDDSEGQFNESDEEDEEDDVETGLAGVFRGSQFARLNLFP